MSLLGLFLGSIVGLSLGLTGGGGAIFAVPLLVFGLQVDPREAIGVSMVTVGVTAIVGFVQRWMADQVEVRPGLLFAASGMLTAPLGSWLSTQLPERLLLIAFAGLMLFIALWMWRQASRVKTSLPIVEVAMLSNPMCHRTAQGELMLTSRCAWLLSGVGLGCGILTGLFGVGGGFIIVPALGMFSRMTLQRAVGTSLMVMALVSSAGVASMVIRGNPIPWQIVSWFTGGSLLGLFTGGMLASRLGGPLLQRMFAVAIVGIALWVVYRYVVGI